MKHISLSTPVMFELGRIRQGLLSLLDEIGKLELPEKFHRKYRIAQTKLLQDDLSKALEVSTIGEALDKLYACGVEIREFAQELNALGTKAKSEDSCTAVSEEPVKGNLMKIDLNSPDAPQALIKVFSNVMHGAGFVVLRTPEEINRYFQDLTDQTKASPQS